MAERRRLLLTPDRLMAGGPVLLNTEEQHYLRRVLRLRCGGRVDVTDGCGRLSVATLLESNLLEIDPTAVHIEAPPQPQLGLAVALMRRGMDEVIRMACELGIDRIQPIRCERCVPQAEHRPERWASIVREAVEQCERLWMPQLLAVEELSQWMGDDQGQRLVGVTREIEPPALNQWLVQKGDPLQLTWLVIGPEGGWTTAEKRLLTEASVHPIQLGSSILRSSTAAVAGAVELVRWRDGLISS
ncbi:16S rRNA (uracil(1498)-N(3))-methyltransferase [Synechococcus sp. MU1648]|uniref:16S rRNA (uracil(1498)-N(3))-methyltransferase n=1 Tax=unclassified Synechococcus TaxID=2626047 RepID=UPI001CF856DE|nr:16S rRNA (uracil(1498)-N(3))-methyltransferase [Synechococcus sp. MU1650]